MVPVHFEFLQPPVFVSQRPYTTLAFSAIVSAYVEETRLNGPHICEINKTEITETTTHNNYTWYQSTLGRPWSKTDSVFWQMLTRKRYHPLAFSCFPRFHVIVVEECHVTTETIKIEQEACKPHFDNELSNPSPKIYPFIVCRVC